MNVGSVVLEFQAYTRAVRHGLVIRQEFWKIRESGVPEGDQGARVIKWGYPGPD